MLLVDKPDKADCTWHTYKIHQHLRLLTDLQNHFWLVKDIEPADRPVGFISQVGQLVNAVKNTLYFQLRPTAVLFVVNGNHGNK